MSLPCLVVKLGDDSTLCIADQLFVELFLIVLKGSLTAAECCPVSRLDLHRHSFFLII